MSNKNLKVQITATIRLPFSHDQLGYMVGLLEAEVQALEEFIAKLPATKENYEDLQKAEAELSKARGLLELFKLYYTEDGTK